MLSPLPEDHIVALHAHRRRVGRYMQLRAVDVRMRVERDPAILRTGPLQLTGTEDRIDDGIVEGLIELLARDLLHTAVRLRPDDFALRVVEILFRVLDRAVLRVDSHFRQTVGELRRVRQQVTEPVILDGLLRPLVAVRGLRPGLDLRRDGAVARLGAVRDMDGRWFEILAVLAVR